MSTEIREGCESVVSPDTPILGSYELLSFHPRRSATLSEEHDSFTAFTRLPTIIQNCRFCVAAIGSEPILDTTRPHVVDTTTD
jgi:hypothetical protein